MTVPTDAELRQVHADLDELIRRSRPRPTELTEERRAFWREISMAVLERERNHRNSRKRRRKRGAI